MKASLILLSTILLIKQTYQAKTLAVFALCYEKCTKPASFTQTCFNSGHCTTFVSDYNNRISLADADNSLYCNNFPNATMFDGYQCFCNCETTATVPDFVSFSTCAKNCMDQTDFFSNDCLEHHASWAEFAQCRTNCGVFTTKFQDPSARLNVQSRACLNYGVCSTIIPSTGIAMVDSDYQDFHSCYCQCSFPSNTTSVWEQYVNCEKACIPSSSQAALTCPALSKSTYYQVYTCVEGCTNGTSINSSLALGTQSEQACAKTSDCTAALNNLPSNNYTWDQQITDAHLQFFVDCTCNCNAGTDNAYEQFITCYQACLPQNTLGCAPLTEEAAALYATSQNGLIMVINVIAVTVLSLIYFIA